MHLSVYTVMLLSALGSLIGPSLAYCSRSVQLVRSQVDDMQTQGDQTSLSPGNPSPAPPA